jgi:hypothetical protein
MNLATSRRPAMLADMIRALTFARVTAVSLTDQSPGGAPRAVAVLMVNPLGIRRCGPLLERYARSTGQNSEHRIGMDLNVFPLQELFLEMKRVHCVWGYFKVEFDFDGRTTPSLLWVTIGPDLETLAAELTAAGCPTAFPTVTPKP